MFCVIAEFVDGTLELWSEHSSKNEAQNTLYGWEEKAGVIGFTLYIKIEGVFYEVH